jgi:recombinational DNA repair protein RecT
MSTELALTKQQKSRLARDIKRLSGGGLDAARELLNMQSLMARNKDLARATPESLIETVSQAAAMGLSLAPQLGHCYAIPRRARRKQNNESWDDYKKNVPTVSTASPGYRGLIHLAVKSGGIVWCKADVIGAEDDYRSSGPFDAPYMRRNLRVARDQATALGVFAVVKLPAGDLLTEELDRAEVMAIKGKSEQANSLMWTVFWMEAWKKAAIRRQWKTLPMAWDSSVATAIEHMDKHEGISIDEEQESDEGDVVETLSDEQRLTLSAMCQDNDLSPDKLLRRLAGKYGCPQNDINLLPVAQFEEARAFLAEVIQKHKG